MRLLRTSRWILLAVLLSLVPASSFAGVFISVGFAPPVLPVYEQPPCPEPGWIWTPGYWAYGADGYYWVPGSWVPAPYEGALWTPPYWGWSGGAYIFHPGYWGRHVGYYGGVNYGFGYMGVGFVGGYWHGHDFLYNTAVVRVNTTVIHRTYVDRNIVVRNTIVNDRRVSFNGGPNGIRHAPMDQERLAIHDNHIGATSYQSAHIQAARGDHGNYARFNNGNPHNAAMDRPMGYNRGNGNPHNDFRGGPQNRQMESRPQQHGNPHYDGGGHGNPHGNGGGRPDDHGHRH